MNALKIGRLVRHEREKKNIFRNTLAKKANLSPISLYRLEEKGKLPRYDKMIKIKSALGLTNEF